MFKSKVTALKASKTRVYPSIRLPREYGEVIGSNAEIIPTSHEGKQAFLVVINKESVNSEPLSPIEKKIMQLETEINRIKSDIYENESVPALEIEKEEKISSPARIRTTVFGSKGRKD